MKNYIKIQSKGRIQAEAFTLLGASSKRDDNTKIGFFGSGLKYAIAYMLREKVDFKVFSDYGEIKFTLKPSNFRETQLDIICVNGKETSMTTSMGVDWEPWFILREIYCNAIDEGGSSIETVHEKQLVPVEDNTVFYIEANSEFQKIMNLWDYYFCENRKDILYYDMQENQLFVGGEELIVYRKGIRCLFLKETKCVFNYNVGFVEINESRVIKDDWDFKYKVSEYFRKIADVSIIQYLMKNIIGKFEYDLFWHTGSMEYNPKWLEAIGEKTLVPYENAGHWQDEIEMFPHDFIMLPKRLVDGLQRAFAGAIKVIGEADGMKTAGDIKFVKELTEKQKSLLDDSVDFLKKAGYEIGYPIKVVDFLRKEILGQANSNTILLSQRLFEMGRKDLVACIIEENEHLITGFNDETRALQSHFIGKYVGELEAKTGRYL